MRRLMGSVFCLASITVVLVSCAESVHQRERLGLGAGPSQAPEEVSDSARASAEPESAPLADGRPSAHLHVHQGQVVMLSGTVLKAKQLNGVTEIEILQLPSGADGRPTEDRRQSQGRFLAKQTTFLDPAVLATGPMVTVLGMVEDEVERPLEPGADNYSYPVLAIQQLTVWPLELLQPNAGSYAAPGSATGLSGTEASGDFALNFLGSILTGIVQAIFNPDRHDQQRSSYSSTSSQSSSSPSHSSSPSQKDIPPQFQKNQH